MFQLFNRTTTPTAPTAEERAARQAAALKLAEEHLRPRIKHEDYDFPVSVGYRQREFVEATLRRRSEDTFRVVLDTNSNGAYVLRYGRLGINKSAALSLPGAESRETTLLIAAALGVSVHRQLAARMARHDRREMAKLREDLADYRRTFRGFAATGRFEVVAAILKTEYSREAEDAIRAFRASLAH